jgi:hypothetical protein
MYHVNLLDRDVTPFTGFFSSLGNNYLYEHFIFISKNSKDFQQRCLERRLFIQRRTLAGNRWKQIIASTSVPLHIFTLT